MKTLTEDSRKIRELRSLEDSLGCVGTYVDEIIPYNENGEMASVVWFVIIKGGRIINRVNSKYVAVVTYAKE